MLKKLKTCVILIILLFILLYTLINSQYIMSEVLKSCNIFITSLFPALFFFFLLGDLLINYSFVNVLRCIFDPFLKRTFHIGGSSSFVIIMSMFSGFPSGSKYISSLIDKEIISYDVGNYLLSFTHFSNPLFILGTISSILNYSISLKILFAHYISNFIIAFLIRPKTYIDEGDISSFSSLDFTSCLSNSIYETFKILVFIFGNSIFFNCVSSIITSFCSNDVINCFIFGFFDLTKGIVNISDICCSTFFKSILVISFLSFGGINVHLQVINIIKQKRKLKYKNFLLGRISQCAISLIILLILIAN